MIKLTKFDGDTFIVNVFLIQKIEGQHETRLIFNNGNTQLVKETAEEVQEKVMECYKSIFTGGLLLTELNSKESEQ